MPPPLHLSYDQIPTAGGGTIPSYAELAGNATSTAAYVELLTTNVTVHGAASALLILLSWSGAKRTNTGTILWRIKVDGAAVATGEWYAQDPGFSLAALCMQKVNVAAGAHTVSVEWKHDAPDAQIQALGLPDRAHASLTVREVRA